MTTTSHQEELLDEALEETFPASDPPRAFQPWPERGAVSADDRKIWKRVLVATDLTERGREVLARILDIARALDASIDLVHVRDRFVGWAMAGATRTDEEVDAARRSIDRALIETAQQVLDAGVSCQTTSLEGSPAHEIVTHALKTRADLIVLGSRGHGGVLHALVPNVVKRITRTAPCAVLVIPVLEEISRSDDAAPGA